MSTSVIFEHMRTLLERTAPFDRLTEKQFSDLLADLAVEYFEAGEIILRQGGTAHKGLYVVESGLVRLMDVERHLLIEKCGEGAAFGSFGLLKGGGLIYEAKALEPTVCALLRIERFHRLYDENPAFADYFEQDLKEYIGRWESPVDVSAGHLLFRRRLERLGYRDVVTCEHDVPARDVARLMDREKASSVLVVEAGEVAGLVTKEDLFDHILVRGLSSETPARSLTGTPVAVVPGDANLYDAIMAMLQHQAQRLVVLGKNEQFGVLTDRDIAHYRGQDPLATVAFMQQATTITGLVGIRTEMNEQLLQLHRQGARPEMLKRTISVLYDRLVIRVLELVDAELQAERSDLYVELPWAWLRLGSGGRQEMSMTSLQNNALIYADPTTPEEARQAEQWFALVAGRANAALEACGFAAGPVLAREAPWRRSIRQWQQAYRDWILKGEAPTLAAVAPYFDLRSVHGDPALVYQLEQDLQDVLNVHIAEAGQQFIRQLARQALKQRPPLSFFQRFALERDGAQRGTFNIRLGGTLPVVEAARALALDLRYFASTNTFDRLRHVADALPAFSDVAERTLAAYRYLVDSRLEHQLRAVEAGEQPSDHLHPDALSRSQRSRLRDAFLEVGRLQEGLAKGYNL